MNFTTPLKSAPALTAGALCLLISSSCYNAKTLARPADQRTEASSARPESTSERTADAQKPKMEGMRLEDVKKALTAGSGEPLSNPATHKPNYPNLQRLTTGEIDQRDEGLFVLIGAAWCGSSREKMPTVEREFNRLGLAEQTFYSWDETSEHKDVTTQLKIPQRFPAVAYIEDGELVDFMYLSPSGRVEQFVRRQKQQVEFHFADRTAKELGQHISVSHEASLADFSNFDLRGRKFAPDSNFSRTSFRNANLTETHANGVLFLGADFSGAEIKGMETDSNTLWLGAICPDGRIISQADASCVD